MTVAHILEEKGPHVVSIAPDASIAEAVDLLEEKGVGAVLVCTSDGDIAGVLSERDVVRGLAKVGAGILNQPVESLMTAAVHTVSPTATIANVMELMTSRRVRHLPVVDDGRLAGVISIGDVVKHRIAEAQQEAEALKSYIQTAQ